MDSSEMFTMWGEGESLGERRVYGFNLNHN